MLRKILFASGLLAVVALVGCAAGIKANLKNNPSVKKVAVVSLAVSDWGGSVKEGSVGKTSVHSLMQKSTDQMLSFTEKELAKHWKVVKARSFIGNAKYRHAAEDLRVATFSPVIHGKEMPLFGAQFKRGDIAPAKAKELCAALKVDAVVLIFSEWTARTGGFVPMTKAVSKNVVSFWDSKGEKIYFRRIDMAGRKPIGAMGIKAVNQSTIEQWTGSYETALEKMFAVL